MARVPIRPLPRGGVAPLPNVRPRPVDDYRDIAAVGEGLQQAAKGLGAVHEVEENQQRDARLMKAYADLGEVRLGVQTAIRGVRGPDALQRNLEAEGLGELRKAAEKIAEGLPDEDLKTDFLERLLTNEEGDLRRVIAGHVEAQGQEAKKDALAAALRVAVKKAEAAGGDAVSLQRAREEGLQALRASGGFVQADEAAFLESIEKVSIDDAARRETDRIAASTSDPVARRAAVEAITNTKLRDAVSDRMKTREALDEAATKDRDKALLAGIRQRLVDTRGTLNLEKDDDYKQLSPDGKAWAKEHAAARQREVRQDRAEARREQAAVNQGALWAFAALTPEEAAKLDVRSWKEAAGADEVTLKHLEANVSKVRQAIETGLGVELGEFQKRVKQVAAEVIGGEAPQFESAMQGWYFSHLDAATGKKPTAKDINEALAEALLIRDIPGARDRESYRLGKKAGEYKPAKPEQQTYAPSRELAARRLAEPAPGSAPALPTPPAVPPLLARPAGVETVHDIPKAERDQIEAALRERNRTVSDPEVLRLYRKAHPEAR